MREASPDVPGRLFVLAASLACAACSPTPKDALAAPAPARPSGTQPAQADAPPPFDTRDAEPVLNDAAREDAGRASANHARILEFLGYLASVTKAGERAHPDRYVGFDARRFASVDVKQLLQYISERGVTFEDVNSPTFHVSKDQLRQAIARRGRAFRSLAHLGYIHWDGPGGRSIDIHESPDEAKVWVGKWYELVFRTTGERAGLMRVRYLVEEAE